MNDETREQLSAYLDGALTETERRDLDARLAASAELRGALEDLRAVSRAVKDLPKEPLPAGFMARFQARRARGDEPRREWVFLPPQARPVVAALSFGVVALMIWDKVTAPPEQAPLHSPGDAKVYEPSNAPVAQLDLSRGMSAAGGTAGAADAVAAESVSGGRATAVRTTVADAGAGALARCRGAAADVYGRLTNELAHAHMAALHYLGDEGGSERVCRDARKRCLFS